MVSKQAFETSHYNSKPDAKRVQPRLTAWHPTQVPGEPCRPSTGESVQYAWEYKSWNASRPNARQASTIAEVEGLLLARRSRDCCGARNGAYPLKPLGRTAADDPRSLPP